MRLRTTWIKSKFYSHKKLIAGSISTVGIQIEE